MRKTVVLNVVGLSAGLIGRHTPRLAAWAARGRQAAVMPVLPAVTCSVQATYLTGTLPREHGIVGNGWYFRDECEVKFWRQSNHLVQRPKLWERARELDSGFTCAKLFWWYNMYSSADVSITPRPMYPADGRKLPDIYTQPAELRDELQQKLGQFPLFEFWGPATTIRSSRWIAEAAMEVERRADPTLSLVYLPHLDYGLQRLGPDHPEIPKHLEEIDALCGELIDFYEQRGAQVVVLSEYGITPVSRGVTLNQTLRARGYVQVREELGRELLDAGASRAFAVADHQLAHVYVRDPSDVAAVRELIEGVPGVAQVLDRAEQAKIGLDHPRAGELVALAEPDSWFSYYYWLDERRAPDFARTVDIHRKPGYDPVELFLDPRLRHPKLSVGWRLLKKKLGQRYLMDVIPLQPDLVKGSHGLAPQREADAPVFVTQQAELLPRERLEAVEVHDLLLSHLTGRQEQLRSHTG
jgi:predicted AlkP superfamily pyrophosphatase or phosphodiesterase